MGEAKRRQLLGIGPRKIIKEMDESDRFIKWLPFSKKQIYKYPYAAPVTMAIGLLLLLIDWTSFNTGS